MPPLCMHSKGKFPFSSYNRSNTDVSAKRLDSLNMRTANQSNGQTRKTIFCNILCGDIDDVFLTCTLADGFLGQVWIYNLPYRNVYNVNDQHHISYCYHLQISLWFLAWYTQHVTIKIFKKCLRYCTWVCLKANIIQTDLRATFPHVCNNRACFGHILVLFIDARSTVLCAHDAPEPKSGHLVRKHTTHMHMRCPSACLRAPTPRFCWIAFFSAGRLTAMRIFRSSLYSTQLVRIYTYIWSAARARQGKKA